MAHTTANTNTNQPRTFGNKAKASPFDLSQIAGSPHDMPDKYFERNPKFSGNCATTIEDHIDVVWSHLEAYGVEEEDVYMRGFLFSLEGEACRWFDRLLSSSIGGYDAFVTILKIQWSAKMDGKFLLNQLFEIKKKENGWMADSF